MLKLIFSHVNKNSLLSKILILFVCTITENEGMQKSVDFTGSCLTWETVVPLSEYVIRLNNILV